MTQYQQALAASGVTVPSLLLPAPGVDLTRWATVACDQYTAEPDYWRQVAETVGNAPSTYHMIFPEVYLAEGLGRVPGIHQTMRRYLAEGVLRPAAPGLALVARQVGGGLRLGLMLAVDLERYDFAPGSQSLIRPTEGTVTERIPPRVQIRQGAPLECPHVMLLVDDPGRTLIEPLYAARNRLPLLYKTELMQGGGALQGWAVTEECDLAQVAAALTGLREAADGLLFAVGDGNHSLATARQCWLNLRESLTAEQRETHPARHALVEVVNLHDPALEFEGIHRALFGVAPAALLAAWQTYAEAQGLGLANRPAQPGELGLSLVTAAGVFPQALTTPKAPLVLSPLQDFLDGYLTAHPNVSIDYIHGEASLRALCAAPDAAGFLLPGFDKTALFPAVRQGGALPRKTFSMGEAHEKRYYLECRKIL